MQQIINLVEIKPYSSISCSFCSLFTNAEPLFGFCSPFWTQKQTYSVFSLRVINMETGKHELARDIERITT